MLLRGFLICSFCFVLVGCIPMVVWIECNRISNHATIFYTLFCRCLPLLFVLFLICTFCICTARASCASALFARACTNALVQICTKNRQICTKCTSLLRDVQKCNCLSGLCRGKMGFNDLVVSNFGETRCSMSMLGLSFLRP